MKLSSFFRVPLFRPEPYRYLDADAHATNTIRRKLFRKKNSLIFEENYFKMNFVDWRWWCFPTVASTGCRCPHLLALVCQGNEKQFPTLHPKIDLLAFDWKHADCLRKTCRMCRPCLHIIEKKNIVETMKFLLRYHVKQAEWKINVLDMKWNRVYLSSIQRRSVDVANSKSHEDSITSSIERVGSSEKSRKMFRAFNHNLWQWKRTIRVDILFQTIKEIPDQSQIRKLIARENHNLLQCASRFLSSFVYDLIFSLNLQLKRF